MQKLRIIIRNDPNLSKNKRKESKYMFISKDFAILSNEEVANKLGKHKFSQSIYLWGMSTHNVELFSYINPQILSGIFDNDDNLIGKEYYGLKISKFYASEKIIIVSAVGNPLPLYSQLLNFGINDFYLYIDDTSFSNIALQISLLNESVNHFSFNDVKKFRFLHIIEDGKFVHPVFEILKNGFNIKEHCFLIFSIGNGNFKDKYKTWHHYLNADIVNNNVCLIDGYFDVDNFHNNRIKKLFDCIISCEKIIFHGEWISSQVIDIFSKMLPYVKCKGVFIPMDGQIGKDKIFQNAIDAVLKFCPLVVTSLNKIDPFMDHNLRDLGISYAVPHNRLRKVVNKRKKVLISHAAARFCFIEEAMNFLSKFSDKIDVYCLSSYGDECYANECLIKGKEIFGLHYHDVRKYMPLEEYFNFINTIDIGVFAQERSCGMTGIRMMSYLGTKLYLKPNTDTSAYVSVLGIKWNDINEISNISFDDFCKNDFCEQNYQAMCATFDPDTVINNWRRLFEFNLAQI